MMVILKIPVVYLSLVIYHAVKAEPKPEEGAAVTVGLGDDDGSGGMRLRPRRGRPGPHGRPTRSYPRVPRTAAVTASKRRQ